MQHVYGHPKDNLKADVAKTSTLSGAQISFHLFLASKSSLRHSPLWPTLSVQVDDVQDLSGTIDFPTRSPTGISGIGISGTASHCSAPASPQRSRLSSFSLVFLSLSLSFSLLPTVVYRSTSWPTCRALFCPSFHWRLDWHGFWWTSS